MAKLWDKNDHQNHPIFDPSLVRTDPPDQLRLESGKTTTTPINISQPAFNPEDDLENICDENTEYIRPQSAKNRDGEFQFIVNEPGLYPEYRQVVKVTTCTRPVQECGQGEIFSSVSTSCIQEYSDHKLVALSKTGEELVVDTFSFPSCCVCKVHRSLGEL